MTKNTQKGSLFDLKITLFFNVLGNFFQQKKGHFLQNLRTKLLTRVIYIFYIPKKYEEKLRALLIFHPINPSNPIRNKAFSRFQKG